MARTIKLLSIAGSDPSGGAGIQADLKTFAAHGADGMAAIAALTAQNAGGVLGAYPVAAEIVAAQIDALLAEGAPDAVKIGMVATPQNAAAIAASLGRSARNVVIDPVLIPTEGVTLSTDGLPEALIASLLPIARLVTPNLHEAAALTKTAPAQGIEDMAEQARRLVAAGVGAALVTGGDLSGEPIDVLVAEGETRVFRGRRVVTRHTHGTGCAFSSAVAAGLAKGEPLIDAVAAAKIWLEGALAAAEAREPGAASGSPHHFYLLWR